MAVDNNLLTSPYATKEDTVSPGCCLAVINIIPFPDAY